METSTTRETASATVKPSSIPGLGAIGMFMESLKVPRMGMDLGRIAEFHRKDVDALLQANREMYEGLRALRERRNTLVTEELTQVRELFKSLMNPMAFAQGPVLAQKSVERAMQGWSELVQLDACVRVRAWRVLQERLQARLERMPEPVQATDAS